MTRAVCHFLLMLYLVGAVFAWLEFRVANEEQYVMPPSSQVTCAVFWPMFIPFTVARATYDNQRRIRSQHP